MARREPYTPTGLRRKRCVCGQPASEQFQVSMCADTTSRKGSFIPLCFDCDLKMNEQVLKVVYGDTPEVRLMIETYKNRNNDA